MRGIIVPLVLLASCSSQDDIVATAQPRCDQGISVVHKDYFESDVWVFERGGKELFAVVEYMDNGSNRTFTSIPMAGKETHAGILCDAFSENAKGALFKCRSTSGEAYVVLSRSPGLEIGLVDGCLESIVSKTRVDR